MTRLPTRLLRGRTIRVTSLNSIEVELQLGFGVSIRRAVRLEGIDESSVPRHCSSEAKHCLVVLLGGKHLLVHTDVHRQARTLVGRVYLDERVYGDPVGMEIPFGMDEYRLDVSAFYDWLRTQAYDIRTVKAVLNGNGTPKSRG